MGKAFVRRRKKNPPSSSKGMELGVGIGIFGEFFWGGGRGKGGRGGIFLKEDDFVNHNFLLTTKIKGSYAQLLLTDRQFGIPHRRLKVQKKKDGEKN